MTTTKILLEFSPKAKNILPAVKKICETFGYLEKKDAATAAQYFGVPLSQIYETASFYDMTRTEKEAEILIQVCDSAACAVSGAFSIIKEIEDALKIREGDENNPRVKLEAVSCLGRCGEGPIMVVNGEVYEKVDEGKVHEILGKYL